MLPENMVTLRSHLHLTNFYAYMFLPTLPAFMGSCFFSDIPSASFDNAFK